MILEFAESKINEQLRILYLAFRFAMIHIGDGDELGEWARELNNLIRQVFQNEHMDFMDMLHKEWR